MKHNPIRFIRSPKTRAYTWRALAMGLCLAITLFVMGSSFETAFGYDLPYFNSVQPVDLRVLTRQLSAADDANQLAFGNYGKPSYLKIPSIDSKMVLTPAITRGGDYLARVSAAHYLLTGAPNHDQLGNVTAYSRTSWQTVPAPERIKPGDNMFVDTDKEWRYLYRVDSVTVKPRDQTVILSDDGRSKLLILFDTPPGQPQLVVIATQVNVQSVRI